MTKTTFKVAKRSELKPRRLRREGKLPANVYISHKDSIALELSPLEFKKLFQEVGETGLIYLQVDGETKAIPALIDQVDHDSVSGNVQHVVFRAVDLKEKIRANIPVEVVGEFDVPEAVLITIQDSVEVEALPTDFPEKFILDLSLLKAVGDRFTLANLDYNHDEVVLVIGEDEKPEDVLLISVQEQAAEEVEEVIESEGEETLEPELVGEKKAEESATEDAKE